MLHSPMKLASLALLAGCASSPGTAPDRTTPTRTRTIEVRNQFRTHVDIYPVLGETTLWSRIARVPPYSRRRVDVPAPYFRRDFRIVVCRTSGVRGEPMCVRTNRLTSSGPVPVLVVFPTDLIHAELSG